MRLEYSILSKSEREENLRVSNESKRFFGTLPVNWRFTEPLWDLKKSSHIYTVSDRNADTLKEVYPNGLLLGEVNFNDLDAKLVSIFRKNSDELWCAHYNEKIARAILNWSEGIALTPPMIRVYNEFKLKEITINDGSHRLAVARALGVKRIYALFNSDEYLEIQSLLPNLKLVVF